MILPIHSQFTIYSLLGTERLESLNPEQRHFARDEDGGMPLLDVAKKYKPTILLGVTAVGGLFTEDLIREMASNVERPIIFPLSNPTTKAECTAEQAYEWTDGRCIFASGSPFEPVELDDGRMMYPSQCNNSKYNIGCSRELWHTSNRTHITRLFHIDDFLPQVYVFPGLGLGVTLCGSKTVTDRMLYIAAEALAKFVPEEEIAQGKVFPPIDRIREVSHRIAVAVIKEADRSGQATKLTEKDRANLDDFVARKMYYPEYVPLVEKRTVTI